MANDKGEPAGRAMWLALAATVAAGARSLRSCMSGFVSPKLESWQVHLVTMGLVVLASSLLPFYWLLRTRRQTEHIL